MYELIFQDSMGNRRVISCCKNYDDVMKCINAFIRACRSNKHYSYYIDMHEENNTTIIQVGTHEGLFLVKPSLEVE